MISAIENQRWVRVIRSRTYEMVAKLGVPLKLGWWSLSVRWLIVFSTKMEENTHIEGARGSHTWWHWSYLMTYGHTWWTLRRLAQLDHWMTDVVAKCKCFVIYYVMQGESFTFMVLDYVGSIKKMKQITGSHQWWWCIYDIHVMNVLAKQVLAVVTKFWY